MDAGLRAAAEAVAVTGHIAACRDATDDQFLELAVDGEADVIVSGDADLPVLDLEQTSAACWAAVRACLRLP